MPALSPTMEEGTLAKWLVKEGDSVESGDVMAEIETDKATMEFEAVDEGVIGKIIVPEGSTGIKVNEIIAILLEDGEDSSDIETNDAENKQDVVDIIKNDEKIPVVKSEKTGLSSSKERIFATPLARRIAKSTNVDLANIKGSGPYGRIVKADVIANTVPDLRVEKLPIKIAATSPTAPPTSGISVIEKTNTSSAMRLSACTLINPPRPK